MERPAEVTKYMGCLGERQVQSKAVGLQERFEATAGRASVLLRTPGLQQTENTIPRGFNENEMY